MRHFGRVRRFVSVYTSSNHNQHPAPVEPLLSIALPLSNVDTSHCPILLAVKAHTMQGHDLRAARATLAARMEMDQMSRTSRYPDPP